MLQALCRNEGALLLLPASATWDITRLDAAESALSQQASRMPTLEEVAKRVSTASFPLHGWPSALIQAPAFILLHQWLTCGDALDIWRP